VNQGFGYDRRAEADTDLGVPEMEIGLENGKISPCQCNYGCCQEQDAAGSFLSKKPLGRLDDLGGKNPIYNRSKFLQRFHMGRYTGLTKDG